MGGHFGRGLLVSSTPLSEEASERLDLYGLDQLSGKKIAEVGSVLKDWLEKSRKIQD